MARPHLVSPDQPVPVRILLHVYQFLASLSLAVVLISTLAATLALGTFVEAKWNTSVVQFFVYRSWWFNVLLASLAINIFCAAAIRFPWKKHQTGFVITHAGLLTLVAGTAMSRMHGIDAQITVFEFDSNPYAIDRERFHLDIDYQESGKSSDPHESVETHSIEAIKFRPGPFNWEDYDSAFGFTHPDDFEKLDGDPNFGNQLSAAPMRFFRWFAGRIFSVGARHRAGAVLYDEDGIRIEATEFHIDSRRINAPYVQLLVSNPPQTRKDMFGKDVVRPTTWSRTALSVSATPDYLDAQDYPNGVPADKTVGGGSMLFQLSGCAEHTDAFLQATPEGDFGEKGQVVLFAEGKTFRISVDEKLGQGRFPLEGTAFEAEIAEHWKAGYLAQDPNNSGRGVWAQNPDADSDQPVVVVKMYKQADEAGRLLLFVKDPKHNIHDYENKIFGDYWYNYSEFYNTGAEAMVEVQTRMKNGISSRIEILQGHDQKLYYRFWDQREHKIAFARELPIDGSDENAVEIFKMRNEHLKAYVSDFVPAEKPMLKTLPEEFDRTLVVAQKKPTVKVKVTLDDVTEEFWLDAYLGDPTDAEDLRKKVLKDPKQAETSNIVHVMTSKDRTMAVMMPWDAIDIGFRVRVNRFERKLDPGTSQASHFSSTVNFIDRNKDATVFRSGLDGEDMHELPMEKMHEVGALELHDNSGSLYWTDLKDKQIKRLRFREGKDVETILQSGVGQPHGLAVDKKGNVYWSTEFAVHGETVGMIRRSDADGSNPSSVRHTKSLANAIALDEERGLIYWIERDRAVIARAPLDDPQSGAGNGETLISKVKSGHDIVVDSDSEKIYWSAGNGIFTAGLDGAGMRPIVTRDKHLVPLGLALDSENGRLYWTEKDASDVNNSEDPANPYVRQHQVMWCDLNDYDPQPLASETGLPAAIAVSEGAGLFWTEEAILQSDVWITMNAPVEFTDPYTGRRFRVFQESYAGPWKPGEGLYEHYVPASSKREELYQSTLTVNWDPGRGVRVAGCLMICLGIFTMFYMKAYLFKRRPRIIPRRANPSADATT